MPEITLRHELQCDEETFWDKCIFGEGDEYNRRLYEEVLKVPGYQLLEQKDTATQRTRKVRIDPPLGGLPGPAKKLLGDRLSYVEEGVFDRSTRRYTFKVVPSTLAEKTKTSGELYCEKRGEKGIVRIARIRVEVKVFAVGGLIEEKILGDLKASYDAAAAFTNTYLKEKGLITG